jgi:hypothetical protein
VKYKEGGQHDDQVVKYTRDCLYPEIPEVNFIPSPDDLGKFSHGVSETDEQKLPVHLRSYLNHNID